MDREEILAVAEQMLAETPTLVPAAEEPEVTAGLADLVGRLRSGEHVEDELVIALTGSEPLRRRFDELLPSDDVDKDVGYEELPGHGEPVDATYWVCPRGDYRYPVLEVGEPVPPCPTHHLALIPA